MTMGKRWAPGRGWIRVVDVGSLAIWMRRGEDGVRIAVYTADGFGYRTDDRAEVWIVDAAPGSDLPYQVIDKPHRIRWAVDMANHDHVVDVLVLPRSHAGHRRLRRRRKVWLDQLPRRLRDQAEKPWAWKVLGI